MHKFIINQSNKTKMKKILFSMLLVCSLIACNDSKTRTTSSSSLKKRLISNVKYPDITRIQELDTIYHLGDTMYFNSSQFIIKR